MGFLNEPGSYAVCIRFYKHELCQKSGGIMWTQRQQPVAHAIVKTGFNIWNDCQFVSRDFIKLNGRIKKTGKEPDGIDRSGVVHCIKSKNQFVIDKFCRNVPQRRPLSEVKSSI